MLVACGQIGMTNAASKQPQPNLAPMWFGFERTVINREAMGPASRDRRPDLHMANGSRAFHWRMARFADKLRNGGIAKKYRDPARIPLSRKRRS